MLEAEVVGVTNAPSVAYFCVTIPAKGARTIVSSSFTCTAFNSPRAPAVAALASAISSGRLPFSSCFKASLASATAACLWAISSVREPTRTCVKRLCASVKLALALRSSAKTSSSLS